jgi:hypothetical protein
MNIREVYMSFFEKKEVKGGGVEIPLSPSTLAFYEPIDRPGYRKDIKQQYEFMSEQFKILKGRANVLDDNLQIIKELGEEERGRLSQWISQYSELCDKYRDVVAHENREEQPRSCIIL